MKRRLSLGLIGMSPFLFLSSKIKAQNTIVLNLIKRWESSKKYTLTVLDAMPPDTLEFRPSEAQMSFAQHFMHLGFTNNAFIGILADTNTYPDFEAMMQADFFLPRPDPVNLFQPDVLQNRTSEENKNRVTAYVSDTFDYVINSLQNLTDDDLSQGADKEKPWYLAGHTHLDLILRAEMHTAHHRAQAITYLRLQEIQPPGFSKLNTF